MYANRADSFGVPTPRENTDLVKYLRNARHRCEKHDSPMDSKQEQRERTIDEAPTRNPTGVLL